MVFNLFEVKGTTRYTPIGIDSVGRNTRETFYLEKVKLVKCEFDFVNLMSGCQVCRVKTHVLIKKKLLGLRDCDLNRIWRFVLFWIIFQIDTIHRLYLGTYLL